LRRLTTNMRRTPPAHLQLNHSQASETILIDAKAMPAKTERSGLNGTKADNWSTQRNQNPYTGQWGTKPTY
jgi:hypothetical protein